MSTPRRDGSHESDTLTSRSSTWPPFTERALRLRRAERGSERLAVHSQYPSRADVPAASAPSVRRRFSTQSPQTPASTPRPGCHTRAGPPEVAKRHSPGTRPGSHRAPAVAPVWTGTLSAEHVSSWHPLHLLTGAAGLARFCPDWPAARVNASHCAAVSPAGQQRGPRPWKGQGAGSPRGSGQHGWSSELSPGDPLSVPLSFQPPMLMLAREETVTTTDEHRSLSEVPLQHASGKDHEVKDSEVRERPVTSTQTASSRRASHVHIQ